MSSVTFHRVWRQLTDDVADELVRFWVGAGALNEPVARARVKQVAFVARDADGSVVGVSTAYREFNPQLDNYFWYVRALVSEPFRRGRVASDLWVKLRDLLEVDFLSGEDTSAIGIVLEVESEALKKLDLAVWRSGPVFFGKTRRGAHLRVYYFEGATIS